MSLPAGLLKRLEALECRLDGRDLIKVFIFHPDEAKPYWDPEPPEAWQQANPKGHAVILQFKDCGIN